MHLLLHLESIVSDFRHLFNQQNFALFQAFIYGFIIHTGEGTLTSFTSWVFHRRDIGLFQSSFLEGNGTQMPLPHTSSDLSNASLTRGFMSMMRPRPWRPAKPNGGCIFFPTSVIKSIAWMHRSSITGMSLGPSVYQILRCQNPLALSGGCRHRPIELDQGSILKKDLTF